MPALRAVVLSVSIAAILGPGAGLRAAGPDFTRDVRPILSEHCFKCHGPDDSARQANLRLDRREAAVARGESGKTPIVGGRPEASELVRRIFSDDPDEMMPPPAANKPLSPQKRQILRDWIAAGAEFRPHWSFVPPKRARIPAVRNSAWPRNAIDQFILARLEAAGLAPAAEADRYTLVRRASFDLIGLPPTPHEADDFVNDASPNAYERMIDRLLASPHYGERWARRWLDLARYADTNGYEKDRARSIWPYRDWVIRALNSGIGFNRFTIEQLAGDMLPGASTRDRVATGFHRNTMLNEEGGIDPLEFRYYAMVDRVNTTGTVWLGLTVGCAQCHTHKFDPIPHRDYYRMMALLDNADELEIDVPTADIEAHRREFERKLAAAEESLPDRFPPGESAGRAQFESRRDAWIRTESTGRVAWSRLAPESARADRPHLSIQPDDSILAGGDQGKSDVYEVTYEKLPPEIRAFRLEVLPDESLPQHGPGRVYYEGPFGDFVMSELSATADGKPVQFQSASQSFASNAGGARAAIDGNPLTAWSINGGQGRAHAAVFVLAAPLQNVQRLSLTMHFEYYYAAGLGRFRLSATNRPVAADRPVLSPEIDDILAVAAERRSAEQVRRLSSYFATIVPELEPARKEIASLRGAEPREPTTLVLSERPRENPRSTFIHARGEFLQPTARVEPGVPSMFDSSGGPGGRARTPPTTARADQPHDRLAFARWLVDEGNPLVGRVTMNRQWQAFFGRGLVRTTEDFGYQGAPPTHPELLDWLALEFVGRNWSMKDMHRLIVTSATYRQSSGVSALAIARDPENALLGRGPRMRLEGELIRDSALKVSGLLSERVGGPSVFPPQPASVTTEGTYGGLAWNVSTGPDRYRRGLYTFSKRTAPFAMLSTFDAPSGEACVARREVTNTPLQALTLLNDPMFVETARALARDVVVKSVDRPEEIAVALFRRCLIRPPRPRELAALVAFYAKAVERFRREPKEAATVAGTGTEDAANDALRLAAWTAVARGLLNVDEAITKE